MARSKKPEGSPGYAPSAWSLLTMLVIGVTAVVLKVVKMSDTATSVICVAMCAAGGLREIRGIYGDGTRYLDKVKDSIDVESKDVPK